MPNQNSTYPDGFPMTPLAAIDFSYFLSEGEKQEWREWLQTATPEQHNELVDILHSMWQDNQKNAVPDSFVNNNQAPIAPQNNPFAQPIPAPIPSQATSQLPPDPFSNANPFAQSQPISEPQIDFSSQNFNFNPEPQNSFTPTQDETPAWQANNNFVENNPFSQFPEPEPVQQEAPIVTNQNISFPEPTIINPNPAPPPTVIDFPQTEEPIQENYNNWQPIEQPNPETAQEDFSTYDPFNYSQEEIAPVEEKPNQEITLKNLVKDSKYTPNPILEDHTPTPQEFVYKNTPSQNNTSNNSQNNQNTNSKRSRNRDNSEDKKNLDRNENRRNENNQNNQNSQNQQKPQKADRNDERNNVKAKNNNPENTVSFSKIRQSGTKDMLEGLYRTYSEIHQKDQAKYGELLEKVMQILLTFENITDHSETAMTRILEVNDKVVNQAKDIQFLKNTTQSRGGSLQDQIDDLRYDMDKLTKEIRDMRTETRRNYDDISQQLAAAGADAYRQDGGDQRLDLLKSEILKLQRRIDKITGQDSSFQPNPPQNSQPTAKASPIDLRGAM